MTDSVGAANSITPPHDNNNRKISDWNLPNTGSDSSQPQKIAQAQNQQTSGKKFRTPLMHNGSTAWYSEQCKAFIFSIAPDISYQQYRDDYAQADALIKDRYPTSFFTGLEISRIPTDNKTGEFIFKDRQVDAVGLFEPTFKGREYRDVRSDPMGAFSLGGFPQCAP